jgi:molybdate transport system permease protein
MDWQAIGLTMRLAACTTGILLLIGLPVAYWLARSAWRWKFLLEAIVALPLVLPPTVLGFYLLLTLGPHSPLGRSYTALTGQLLPFSFQGLLIASVLYSLPFAVQPFAAAFASVDDELIQVAWTLGASRLRAFWHVVLPLARPGILVVSL